MCDEFINQGLIRDPRLSRRSFGMMTVAAAAVATTARAQTAVSENDVEVTTPDGTCDAVLFYPEGQGTWPAVVIWTDIAGLRPVFRDMGRRLAGQGYVVLVPNPFYRSARAPVIGEDFDFGNEEQRNMLFSYYGEMTPDRVASDSVAFVNFLDAQSQTDTSKKVGVQGYCMGGGLSIRTAAAVPDRIAAVGSFHGGNMMVTDQPDSPHLLIPQTNATFIVAQAQNDDEQNPQVKEDLRAAFAAAGKDATVEVYQANHGWCVPGGQVYNQAEAERAWTALSNLYESTLG